MEWDAAVTRALERMSIYQRERLRQRVLEHVQGEGRDRVTADDLEAVRSRGMGAMGRGAVPPEPLSEEPWPVLGGAYEVLDASAPVAVCTLASETLAADLGHPAGVAILGRAFTENLGAEKVAINVVSNPAIRVLVLCGTESRHMVGQTLAALHADGLDGAGRVIGSQGPLPLLRNFPPQAQAIFHGKIAVIDLIDETDPAPVLAAIESARAAAPPPWGEAWAPALAGDGDGPARPARAPEDPAGMLLLSIGARRDRIVAEHYSLEAELLRSVVGRSAAELCERLMAAGAVSDLGHAAYVGREAQKAELALRLGLPYEQDRPLELPPGRG